MFLFVGIIFAEDKDYVLTSVTTIPVNNGVYKEVFLVQYGVYFFEATLICGFIFMATINLIIA